MTFADWYNANIVPQLEENLKLYPVTAREAVRTASRLAMAACWNAALDAGAESQMKPGQESFRERWDRLKVDA